MSVFWGFGPVSGKQLTLGLYGSLKRFHALFSPGSAVLPHIGEAQDKEERLWLNVIQVNKLEKYQKEDASLQRRPCR